MTILWLGSFEEKLLTEVVKNRHVSRSMCQKAIIHGITPKEFVEVFLPKITEDTTARSFEQMIKEYKTKKKAEQQELARVARSKMKVLERVESFAKSIKRSRYVKYDPSLCMELAEKLRKIAQDLEKMAKEQVGKE